MLNFQQEIKCQALSFLKLSNFIVCNYNNKESFLRVGYFYKYYRSPRVRTGPANFGIFGLNLVFSFSGGEGDISSGNCFPLKLERINRLEISL